jgi:hypothetical protein
MPVMNALLRVLVVGNALLLTLPPGWCCPAPVAEKPAAPPAAPSCCHAEVPPAPDSQPLSCPMSATKCCCQFDSTAPPHIAKYVVDSAWSLPLIPAVSPSVSDAAIAAEAAAILFPSPPINVLQCVWRC